MGSKFRCVDSESMIIISTKFEEDIRRYFNLCKGVFVDVGAHKGKYTVTTSKSIGDEGLVIAVEPHPENYKILMENVRLNSLNNVTTLNVAAWSGEGKLKLFKGDKFGQHSAKKDFELSFINVQARSLDKLLDELNVERVDLIKIDVEGAEFEVIKGLIKTLKRHHPAIIVEIKEEENLAKIMEIVKQECCDIQQIASEYYILKPKED
jgi:FkbM family methyltransferase